MTDKSEYEQEMMELRHSILHLHLQPQSDMCRDNCDAAKMQMILFSLLGVVHSLVDDVEQLKQGR